jgi:hypothetical protein
MQGFTEGLFFFADIEDEILGIVSTMLAFLLSQLKDASNHLFFGFVIENLFPVGSSK